MFVKTRIPKHTNCVLFHGLQPLEAGQLASLFLGGKGRIANAIDVMKARVEHGFDHPIWNCYITTTSTEWFGLGHNGLPCIIVLHNAGPLADEKLLREKYVSKRENRHNFNVIPRQMFLDVCDGKYGEVDFISLKDAISFHNDNNHEHSYLTKEQIEKDVLVKARLGSSSAARMYINVHFIGSMERNLKDNLHSHKDLDNAFLKCDCSEYFPFFIGLTEKPQKYIQDLSRSPINLKTEAVGQFISFGAVANISNMIASEIEPSGANADCAFLAVIDAKEEIRLNDEVCMYSSNDYRDKLSRLFVPNDEVFGLNFRQIDYVKGWYFTQRVRDKIAIGDEQKEWFVISDPTYSVQGEPEYLVKDLKPLGRRTIKVLISEGYYTPQQIKEAYKNPNANAFQIISGFKRRGKYYIAVAEYYKAEFYTDRIIPTEAEILKDYKLLGRIV